MCFSKRHRSHILGALERETDSRAESQVAILNVRDVTVRFGGIIALDRVSFDIEPRQIVGLIGPNGAGKTTLFNCLSRLYTASAGTVTFEGAPLLTVPAHKIAGLGIGRTFQNLALFPTQSVLQNVMVGAHCRTSSDFLSNALKLGWVAREESECRSHAEELLAFLELEQPEPVEVGQEGVGGGVQLGFDAHSMDASGATVGGQSRGFHRSTHCNQSAV